MSGFDVAVPTIASFSSLLKCENYTQWRKLADFLQVRNQTVENIINKLQGHDNKDKRAFLMILASWREKAPKRESEKTKDRIANYRNLRKAMELAGFTDLVEALDEIKRRWSEDDPVDYTFDMCKCEKQKALRIQKTKKGPHLFVICPHQNREKQCKDSFVVAEPKIFEPDNWYKELPDPAKELIKFLEIKKNAVLVNFENLGPHLLTQGLLSFEDHRRITESTGSSQHFEIFVNEFLCKGNRGDIVEKFIEALRNEKKHIGHESLLKGIESNKKIMPGVSRPDESTKPSASGTSSSRKLTNTGQKRGLESEDCQSSRKKKCCTK